MNRQTFMNQAQARATGAFVQGQAGKKPGANVSAFSAGWKAAVAAREAFDVSPHAGSAAIEPITTTAGQTIELAQPWKLPT